MKFLFHLARGTSWQDATHAETLACAEKLVRSYGGTAAEVTLVCRDNAGEPDPPFEKRMMEERAVVIEASIDALAAWAEFTDSVIQLVPCSKFQDSSAGTLTSRLFVSSNDAPGPEFTGGAST